MSENNNPNYHNPPDNNEHFKSSQNDIVSGYMYEKIINTSQKHMKTESQNTQTNFLKTNLNHKDKKDDIVDEFVNKIIKSLVLDHLKVEKLYQTEGVYVPEAKIILDTSGYAEQNYVEFDKNDFESKFQNRENSVLNRSEIVNIFTNKGAFASYNLEQSIQSDTIDNDTVLKRQEVFNEKKIEPISLLKTLISACFPNKINFVTDNVKNNNAHVSNGWMIKKDKEVQCDGGFFGNLDDLDRKLLDIEKDHIKKTSYDAMHTNKEVAHRLEKAISRAKKDLTIEMDESKRVWKDKELKAMREDEKRRLEEKFTSFTKTMEDKIKIKLKIFTQNHESSKSEIKTLQDALLNKERALTEKLFKDSENLELKKLNLNKKEQEMQKIINTKNLELTKKEQSQRHKQEELDLIGNSY